MIHPEAGSAPDLSLYEEEVERLEELLKANWKTAEPGYQEWGGRDEFLKTMAVYVIVEKGLDPEDTEGLDATIDTLVGSSF